MQVRVRPFVRREKKLGCKCVIEMDGPQTTITDPKTGKKHTFTFDYSYWSHDNRNGNIADQQTVYEDLGNNVLKNAWEGYNRYF